MKSTALLLTIAFLWIACQQKAEEKPFYDDQKLARIMADLSVAQAATLGLSGYSKDSLMHAYFKQVFEIHGGDPLVYEKDLQLLSRDLDHFKAIVLESIKLLEVSKDSVNAVK